MRASFIVPALPPGVSSLAQAFPRAAWTLERIAAGPRFSTEQNNIFVQCFDLYTKKINLKK